jgi:hypothetical protein
MHERTIDRRPEKCPGRRGALDGPKALLVLALTWGNCAAVDASAQVSAVPGVPSYAPRPC